MANVLIGTSGWSYRHWAGSFYPSGLASRDQLAFYVRQFPSVEVNFTFYRLPERSMVAGWRNTAPRGFRFAVKGSRYITHMKRLREPREALKRYFDRLEPLRGREGPVLWQLRPDFAFDDDSLRRLDCFLDELPSTWRHAVEFRHPSWHHQPRALDVLRAHRVALTWISSLRMPVDLHATTDFVYLRFHGLDDGAYHHYSRQELTPWARALRASALPAYVYFNNDLNPHVAQNAQLLQRLVGERARIPSTAHPVKGRGGSTPPDAWRSWT